MEHRPKRQALSEISSNTRTSAAISKGVMARNILNRLALTSLTVFRDPSAHAESLFEVPRHGCVAIPYERSDGYWLKHYFEFFQVEIDLDHVFEACAGIDDKQYPTSYDFEGGENWDPNEMYGVSKEDMRRLYGSPFADDEPEFALFLRAEGQLVRLMLAAPDHPGRVVLLHAWLTLWTIFCGSKDTDAICQNLDRLSGRTSQWMACLVRGTETALESFTKLAGYQVTLNAHWIVAMKNINSLRRSKLELLCSQSCMCALHGWDCVRFMEDAQIVHDGNSDIVTVEDMLDDDPEYCSDDDE